MNPQGSTGPEGVSIHMLQLAPCCVLELLLEVFVARLHGELSTVNWTTALVTLIPKVSRATSCKDFRPISVLPVLFKIYEKWLIKISMNFDADLLNRLPPEHHGFRPGYQICEAILVTRLAIEKSVEFRMPLLCIKLDLVKAFDRVFHSGVLSALWHWGFHPLIVRAFHRELADAELRFRTPDGILTDSIPQQRGVRQGLL